MKKSEENKKLLLFPVRANKYLADRGYATRLGADDLIRAGRVTINGKKAVLGSKIMKETDSVVVTGTRKNYRYFAYNKPVGIVTVSPQKGEEAIKDVAGLPKGIFPIGRLDKDSHGLLLLTDDGRITKRLLEPQFEHEKEYEVSTDRPYDDSFIKKITRGVDIGGYVTKPCRARRLSRSRFSIILTEGKNRQIRRMCQALGYTVRELIRVRIMNIELGTLPAGTHRELKGKELAILLKSLGI